MINTKNGELPANATNLTIDEYEGTINCGTNKPLTGLTKREAFAMAAMQGILSHSFGRGTHEELAKQSIKCADALLVELSK